MKESTYKKYCLVIDEWFVNGFNGTQAYLKFYPDSSYESANQSFQEILQNPTILEYKESKHNKTADTLQITLERQLRELEDLRVEAKDEKKFNDAINALKEQNKLVGLYEAHNAQKSTQIITSSEQRKARVDELIEKRKDATN